MTDCATLGKRGIWLATFVSACAGSASAGVTEALQSGQLGPYRAEDFRAVRGACPDCPGPAQARWYFQNELLAVPKAQAEGFEAGARAQDDIRRWAVQRAGQPEGSRPAMLWLGSPQIARGTLSSDGSRLAPATPGAARPFSVVPKIASNLSYYDASSIRHFAGRALKVRGEEKAGGFVARTLWPEDYALSKLGAVRPLAQGETLESLVRAEGGGARSAMSSRLLWSRSGAPLDLAGKPVMAFVLNGAQGDDDEAHGGHFAIATGRFGPQGEWDDWLVNNFYNLDSESEKGIVAAMLPMDAYQADLNSGQSWYRPSYMLVAVLKEARTSLLYQEAISRVFNHFYRHDFRYNHANANCAGISLATLRSLGWSVPAQGATSRWKAIAALPYVAVKEGSLQEGRKAFEYLWTEKTDLYPFVAFTALGEDLLSRLAQGAARSDYEKMLSDDIEALVWVRLPQFPSSRAMGREPVSSLDEYMRRVPEDRTQWQVVPTAARPFPQELVEAPVPSEPTPPSFYALLAYAGVLGGLALAWGRRLISKRRNNKEWA